jgi:hypothetical protein
MRCQNSPHDTLLAILSPIRELSQSVLVNVVDLLANGTSRQPGVVCLCSHDAMNLATHGCSAAGEIEAAVRRIVGVYIGVISRSDEEL